MLQSGLEIWRDFLFTFLNDKHLKFLSLAKPRLGFCTISLYTFFNQKIMKESIQNKLQQSQQSFKKWKNIPFEERQKYFAKLSEILRARKQEFGKIITQEMKKPISQSVAEIEKCATLCDYYAVAKNVLKPEKYAQNFKFQKFITNL